MTTIRLFGPLRQVQQSGEVRIDIPVGCTAETLRALLITKLALTDQARALLAQSVFASDDTVIDEHSPLDAHAVLAVLPPVCGG